MPLLKETLKREKRENEKKNQMTSFLLLCKGYNKKNYRDKKTLGTIINQKDVLRFKL